MSQARQGERQEGRCLRVFHLRRQGAQSGRRAGADRQGLGSPGVACMVQPFPPGIRVEEIETDGATIHTRVGGQGPAVIMLHGFGDTGDMWAPLATALIAHPTGVVPPLRGMGLSSHPERGYDKKTQGQDVARLLDRLRIDQADLVTHDIGNMVGYGFAAQYPTRVTRWVVIDAPLPGIGPWDEILKSPALWHFNFR